MNNNPTYQQPLCSPCATCDESNTTTTRKRDENETRTTASDTVRCVPQLRFPEFQNTGEWREVKVKDIFNITRGQVLAASETKKESNDEYKYPVYSSQTSRNGLMGYYSKSLFHDAITWTTDGANAGTVRYRSGHFYCTNVCGVLISKEGFANECLAELLNIVCKKHVSFVGNPKLMNNVMGEITLTIPSLQEQLKISTCLKSIDDDISATTQKLEQLKTHKNALLQKLFPQRGEITPEIRFPEFQNGGKWETRNLGEVTTIVNKRNRSNRSLPIYSISNKDGFLLQTEQFDGLDSVKRGYDISMYKIVGKNTFAYNPARINVGSIGYSNNLKEVLISSLYVCFKTTEEVDDSFLKCYFDTLDFRQSVESNVEGGIRSYLFYENFSRIKIQLPSIQEQKQIASTLMSINALIEIVENKIALLEEHKKGLLQRLFPSLNK